MVVAPRNIIHILLLRSYEQILKIAKFSVTSVLVQKRPAQFSNKNSLQGKIANQVEIIKSEYLFDLSDNCVSSHLGPFSCCLPATWWLVPTCYFLSFFLFPSFLIIFYLFFIHLFKFNRAGNHNQLSPCPCRFIKCHRHVR